MKLLWDLLWVLLWQMHFYFSMKRFGLMNVLMNSNLCTTEDMLMTCLFSFVHVFILRNSKFTFEKGHNNSMHSLEILIIRTSNGFKASVYHKPTFSGVYSYFNSSFSKEYKVGLIFTLLFRTFLFVSCF